MWVLNNSHSHANKSLKFGQHAIHSIETAKGLYDAARTIAPIVASGIRTIAPIIRTGVAFV